MLGTTVEVEVIVVVVVVKVDETVAGRKDEPPLPEKWREFLRV